MSSRDGDPPHCYGEKKMAEQPQSEQTPEYLDQEEQQPEKAGEEEVPEEPVEPADTEGEKT
jgi:hypothetical protein